MIEALNSELLHQFFSDVGIIISKDSCHNVLELINTKTKERISIWAESSHQVAEGVPGLYIDEEILEESLTT